MDKFEVTVAVKYVFELETLTLADAIREAFEEVKNLKGIKDTAYVEVLEARKIEGETTEAEAENARLRTAMRSALSDNRTGYLYRAFATLERALERGQEGGEDG